MSERARRPSGGLVTVIRGDITRWQGDAIVNAANERMLGGGGVDGAIHRAAGPQLRAACEAIPEVTPGVRCPTGDARLTAAFGRLGCRWVIHTVGPVYRNEGQSAPHLRAAYRSVFRLAGDHGIASLGLPAVSCGVFGYPLTEAAQIAMAAALNAPASIEEITFIMFNPAAYRAFSQALRA